MAKKVDIPKKMLTEEIIEYIQKNPEILEALQKLENKKYYKEILIEKYAKKLIFCIDKTRSNRVFLEVATASIDGKRQKVIRIYENIFKQVKEAMEELVKIL